MSYLELAFNKAKDRVQSLTWTGVLTSLAAYLLLCKALRFQRVRYWQWKLPYKTRASLAGMTSRDAQRITEYLSAGEMPYTVLRSLQFALFRTYGIPSISKLLVKTKQLSTKDNATKRLADTEVILNEVFTNEPGSERANNALGRLNFLHGVYIKSGQISNDDMLFTLSMFALEPRNWIARFEWRELTEVELCAYGVQWKEVGDAMNISYEKLPSYSTGWKNGLHWILELDEWSKSYEEQEMVPNEWNKQTADETVAILLYPIPKPLHGIGRNLISALMDDRLRKAMMYPKPAQGYYIFTKSAFAIRKFIIRHLSLPRFWPMEQQFKQDKKTGRFYRNIYEDDPWYVKPTLWRRYGPESWMKRLIGIPVVGDDGDKYMPQGWSHKEVGPRSMSRIKADETDENIRILNSMKLGGCPFPGAKA